MLFFLQAWRVSVYRVLLYLRYWYKTRHIKVTRYLSSWKAISFAWHIKGVDMIATTLSIFT